MSNVIDLEKYRQLVAWKKTADKAAKEILERKQRRLEQCNNIIKSIKNKEV